ncbi:MAG: hypothetical protein AABX71_00635 [Nanoarchaeota archaeon]
MKEKTRLVLLVLAALALILLSVCSVVALTGSMGNARMILYPEVGFFGTTLDKTILVKNVNNVSVNITLEASEEIADITKILDKNFILEPGEDRQARFELNIRKKQTYDGRIVVMFKSLENEKEPGVALSSRIIIIPKDAQDAEETDAGDEESEEDIEEENLTETGEETESITGKTISIPEISPLAIFSLFTTAVLVVAFILLVLFLRRKRMKRKR